MKTTLAFRLAMVLWVGLTGCSEPRGVSSRKARETHRAWPSRPPSSIHQRR
jgi:hypothetical protein